MNPAALLTRLEAVGIHLTADSSDIVLTGRTWELTPELRAEIVFHKPELLTTLMVKTILAYGERNGYPHICIHRKPDGAVMAWAQGETAWRNRCRLAEVDELHRAYEAVCRLVAGRS